MMRLLLAVITWRIVRRLAVPAILVALATLLLHSGTFVRQERRHAVGTVARVLRPLKHDVQQALGRVLGP